MTWYFPENNFNKERRKEGGKDERKKGRERGSETGRKERKKGKNKMYNQMSPFYS